MNKRLKIFALLIPIVLVLVVASIFNNRGFRMTKTDPPLGKVSTAAPFIDIYFSSNLAKQDVSIQSTPSIVDNYTIEGNRLRLDLGVTQDKREYTVSIKSIKSTVNEEIKDLRLKFTVRYTEFSKLPASQQQNILRDQDISKPDRDPIFTILPYYHTNYELRPYITPGKDKPDILFVYLPAVGEEGNIDIKDRYLQDARNYLQNKGVSLSEYRLVDSEPAGDYD